MVASLWRRLGAFSGGADGDPNTVTRWGDRFLSDGVAGIGVIRDGRARKPDIASATIEAIVAGTLHMVPDEGSTCWTTRSLAARHGVGKHTVARCGRRVGCVRGGSTRSNCPPIRTSRPSWSTLSGCISIRGSGRWFSFDEKAQCQARGRTQRSLPVKAVRGPACQVLCVRGAASGVVQVMGSRSGKWISKMLRALRQPQVPVSSSPPRGGAEIAGDEAEQ